jgi:hypothetical protein
MTDIREALEAYRVTKLAYIDSLNKRLDTLTKLNPTREDELTLAEIIGAIAATLKDLQDISPVMRAAGVSPPNS